jgi:phytoene dehydrogenase-like protein
MNGYQSQIFEHHSVPGGVAACWKREGYFIDGGIHFLMGYKPESSSYRLYQELTAIQNIHIVEMTTYFRYIDEVSQRTVEITNDLDRFADNLKSFSPDDAKAIDELISGAQVMRKTGMSAMGMNSPPPELLGAFGRLKQMWEMRHFLKYFLGKNSQAITDYAKAFKDLWLRKLIENLFLPEVPVWFILALLAMVADGQLGLIADGCQSFVLGIERRYKELGGKVSYNATVEGILVKDNNAIGVRLQDGSVHFADYVISAGDGYNTIFKLLGGKYVDKKIKDRYENWKLFRPTVTISYGVARDFPKEPSSNAIVLKHPLKIGSDEVGGIFIRIFNYAAKFAPPGKTVLQVLFETKWDYWNDLQKDRSGYEALKEQTAAEILERLEPHFPGIKSRVEMTDVATPYTTWRYTLNHKGSPEGFLPTPKTIMTNIPRTLPGLKNFYMAGQWVLPGGGVPPCLYSGRHAIQLICHRERIRFQTTVA